MSPSRLPQQSTSLALPVFLTLPPASQSHHAVHHAPPSPNPLTLLPPMAPQAPLQSLAQDQQTPPPQPPNQRPVQQLPDPDRPLPRILKPAKLVRHLAPPQIALRAVRPRPTPSPDSINT